MVERAAHFSFTPEVKPSIFVVVAQNSLNVTLQPAFQKIIEFLAEWNSKYSNWLTKYSNECFLACNMALQYYYLKNHDASFSEYFYGLKRTSLKNIPLTQKQRYLCLLYLVLFPYLRQKLYKKLEVYKLEEAEAIFTNDLPSKCKKFILRFESAVEVTWSLWLLINYLRYMSDETESQNPILRLLKLKLVYGIETEDDITFWSSLFQGKLNLTEFTKGILPNALRSSIEIGAFFVQFLQTWYREKSNYSITALPTVPPPQPDPNAANYKEKCPICLQAWKLPTVVPISGYVFCFSCIVKYLRENQSCPVTNYPAKVVDLVRLYD
ncbi:hypothetical protein Trydic_g10149 [Trypoxylus dichotomus]